MKLLAPIAFVLLIGSAFSSSSQILSPLRAWEGKKEIVYSFQLDNGSILLFERSNNYISSNDNIALQLSVYNGVTTESLGINILIKSVHERVNMLSLGSGDYLFTLRDASLHIWKSQTNTYKKLDILADKRATNIYSMKKDKEGVYAAVRIGDSLYGAQWNGKNFIKKSPLIRHAEPNVYRNCLQRLSKYNIISTRIHGTFVLDKKGTVIKKIEPIDQATEKDREEAAFYFRYMEKYKDGILCFAGHRAPALYILDTTTFELQKFSSQFRQMGNYTFAYRDAKNRICLQNDYSNPRSTEFMRIDNDSVFQILSPRLQLLKNSLSDNPLDYSYTTGDFFKQSTQQDNINYLLPKLSFRATYPLDEANSFWLGANNGDIHKLNTNTNTTSRLKFYSGNKRINFLLHKKITKYESSYIANTAESFVELHPEQVQIKKEWTPYPNVNYGEICAWILDKENIYFGNYEGPISCYNIGSGKKYSTDPTHKFITQDLIKEGNLLYAATSQGLKTLSIEPNRFKEQAQKLEDFAQPILSLFATPKYLWIGTENNGLLRWDRKDGIKNLSKEQGLNNSSVIDIIQDNKGRIWAATLKGVYILDNEEAENLYAPFESKLSNIEFNRFASYAHTNGTIFLGALYGIYYFNENDVPTLPATSNLYLNSLEYYKDSAVQKSFYFTNSAVYINIPVEHKYLKLSVSQSAISKTDKHTYYYKINNEDWKLISSGNTLELPYLPSGKQNLYIKGKDEYGRELTNQLHIYLDVADYFYKTWWFFTLLVLIIGGITYFWIRRLRNEKIILAEKVKNRTATIEEQKEELKSLDSLKNRFFSNISHELRTPLTLILSPLRKIIKSDAQNINLEESQEILSVMHSNAELLNERIEELLDLSRISSNTIEVSRNQVNLKDFLHEVVTIFKLQAKEKEHTLEVNYNIDAQESYTIDSKRIKRIIQNLIGNAIKYCPQGSKIYVFFKMEKQQLQIIVSDNGQGIAKEDQARVFERFYQVSSSVKNDNPGTGIGLAMVKEYVELLNGTITLESAIDKGSIFTVRLPLLKTEKSTTAVEENLQAPKNVTRAINKTQNDNKPTLLFAEDNTDLRNYISNILSEVYNVAAFADGKQAWDHLQENKYDIILSDIMMPEMDGITLLEKVRSSEKLKNIPFVFLTAKSSKHTKIQAFNIGLDDYVVKPFEEEELLARLHALYTNYKIRIESQEELDKEAVEEKEAIQKTTLDTQKLHDYILAHMGSSSFSIDDAAEHLNIARRTLDRKLKIEKGMTGWQFVKEIQLSTARAMLTAPDNITLAEIADHIGMRDIKYLKQQYQERFGSTLV